MTMFFRQAIVTKFLPTTNTKPGRVKATCQARSLIVSWDHGLDVDANHSVAAQALATAMGWGGTWHGGAMPSGGYAFVVSVDCRSAFITVQS